MRTPKNPAILLLAVLFLHYNFLQAQQVSKKDIKEQERLDEVFGANDPDFTITKAPEKWKNESAVILCQMFSYTFDKAYAPLGGGLHVDEVELARKRILLQDKAAVNEFSEFYFTNTKNVGIHIIKPGGQVINVDVRNAVDVESNTNIPTIFRSSYSIHTSYKKLAINGLEPGDIIDYFYKHEGSIILKYYGSFMVDYSPIIFSLYNSYPTVKQKLTFEVERGFYINERSTNGAPQFKEQVLEKRNVRQFTLVDADRDKLQEERWMYEYRSTPTIKFQVLFPLSMHYNTGYFVGVQGVPKTSVSQDEVKKVINHRAKTIYDSYYTSRINTYLSKYYKKEKDPQVIVPAIYYYLRYLFDQKTNENGDVNTSYISDEYFTKLMGKLLKARKIDYKIVVAVAKTIGDLDDLILKDELYWFIKIEGAKPMYIYPFHTYSNINDKEYQYEGVDAYEIGLNPSDAKATIARVKVPATTFDQNVNNQVINAAINDDMDIISMDVQATIKGHNKERYYRFIEYQSEYDQQEKERYHEKIKAASKGWKGQQGKDERAAGIVAEENIKKRLDLLKDAAGSEYELESYDDFKLVQDGRQYDKQELIFNEKFKVKDLIKKAGANYLLDAGKLIGSQVTIKEDEMDRKYDIYMSFPFSINYTINVALPEGYTVDGLDKLNVKVDNETGSFIATAALEGNALKINVQKIYKESFQKKEKWKLMVDFLDACYNYTQAKVILKKK